MIKDDEDFEDILDGLSKIQDSQSYAKFMTSMDLFRYSEDSANSGMNDLTVGNAAYFSLDGSQTDLALSRGASYDYQGSHWENRELGNGLGVMNPTIALNERWAISQNDLLAMDAIGWDVVSPGETDLETLHSNAGLQAQTALIEDRSKDVDKILDGDAYNWSRRSSTSSSAGWWQESYFSTLNVEAEASNYVQSTTDNSSNCDSDCTEDNQNENNLLVPYSINTQTIFSTTTSDRAEPASQGSSSTDNQNNQISPSTLNQNNSDDTITQTHNDPSQSLSDNSLVNPLGSDLVESLVIPIT